MQNPLIDLLVTGDAKALARCISLVENRDPRAYDILKAAYPKGRSMPVIGVTGPAGVGKSSLVDQLIANYRAAGQTVGVVAVDPSSPFSGGAILGDRIRMQRHGTDPGVFIRSMATRGKLGGISAAAFDVVDLMNAAGKDRIILETVGVGQDEVDVVKIANTTIVVLMPGLGDEVQAMKAGLMEIADVLVINKADRADADKMEAELASVLSFFHHEGTWQAPIIKTIATSGQGIEPLMEAIADHGEYLKRSGTGGDRLLQQSRQRLIDALEDRILNQILEEGADRFGVADKISAIAKRKTDPHTAVGEILKNFKSK